VSKDPSYDEQLFDAVQRDDLEHRRSQGEHVRGCWVHDLLLAKDKLTFPLGARMPLAFRPDQSE
jgi:hypothetical protein